jgi:hypothetical protein
MTTPRGWFSGFIIHLSHSSVLYVPQYAVDEIVHSFKRNYSGGTPLLPITRLAKSCHGTRDSISTPEALIILAMDHTINQLF